MRDGSHRGVLQALGPGLLFAAAAVGVSHLVQSTRAGAVYGLGLLGLVLLANVVKYPAFRFGPLYAVATRTSLLEGYRRQGRWALVLYTLATLGTMFAVIAAIALVTAGLAIATLGLPVGFSLWVAAVLIVACALLLAVGRYHWLDRVTKVLVAVLTLSTLTATLLAVGKVDFAGAWWIGGGALDKKTIFFCAALFGWMPSAIDVAVWQSLWTLARQDDSQHPPTPRESSIDFHIGYVGTAVLAVCFLLMGAGIMHGRGVGFADAPGAFAGQVIDLYAQTLGPWSRHLIGTAAFAVMFSTLLTVVDGFPRALAVLVQRFRGPESPERFELSEPGARRAYWLFIAVLSVGGLVVLRVMLSSLKTMVDVATTLSFLTAPILSLLNHRAVHSAEVPAALAPRPWLSWASRIAIALQAIFALSYLVVRYGS